MTLSDKIDSNTEIQKANFQFKNNFKNKKTLDSQFSAPELIVHHTNIKIISFDKLIKH